ncbi:hypothetical protein RHSIM_Rhsim11G0046000 [Rhododendron simsii]|uniref:Uncharacterized protein n=1 Tax=Rhododendron simsii TaxID=118357 RepID=A0A834GAU0_RHOSS|nr:hypothetical protein RHSIM_Rhsim11G0046000 [Rhododendron simsii]
MGRGISPWPFLCRDEDNSAINVKRTSALIVARRIDEVERRLYFIEMYSYPESSWTVEYYPIRSRMNYLNDLPSVKMHHQYQLANPTMGGDNEKMNVDSAANSDEEMTDMEMTFQSQAAWQPLDWFNARSGFLHGLRCERMEIELSHNNFCEISCVEMVMMANSGGVVWMVMTDGGSVAWMVMAVGRVDCGEETPQSLVC